MPAHVSLTRRVLAFALSSVALCLLTACLGGCFTSTVSLVSSTSFDLSDVEEVCVEFGSDNITLRIVEQDELVLKEYMSEDSEGYLASSTQDGQTLTIKGGQRPSSPQFDSYVEIELPQAYGGSLSLVTGSGSVNCKDALELDEFSLESESGALRLDMIECAGLTFVSTSGSLRIDEISGVVDCSSVSSSLRIDSLQGGGSLTSESGSVRVGMDGFTQALDIKTTSGNVRVYIPDGYHLRTTVTSEDGAVSLPYAEDAIEVDQSGRVYTAYQRLRGLAELDVSTVSGAVSVKFD